MFKKGYQTSIVLYTKANLTKNKAHLIFFNFDHVTDLINA